MRLRRLGADLLDLFFVAPLAVALAYPVFLVGDLLSVTLYPGLGLPISMGLLVWSLVLGWVLAFVIVRIGMPPSAGESLMGLTAGEAATVWWKRWVRAFAFVDLPLGWVLTARPIDRYLHTERVRDHSQGGLEAVGQTLRRKALFLPVQMLFFVLAALAIWAGGDRVGRHQHMLMHGVLAEYDTFCNADFTRPNSVALLRAAEWTKVLAPAAEAELFPPGGPAWRSRAQVEAVLDGPCGRLRPGDAAPPEVSPDAQPMGLLMPLTASSTNGCAQLWRATFADARHPECGVLRVLGPPYSATVEGRPVNCAVFASEGRILAVVARCGL